jgi:hypothetical protein
VSLENAAIYAEKWWSKIAPAIRTPLRRARSMSEPNGPEQGAEQHWEDDEAPEADAVEQHTPLLEEENPEMPGQIPFDASEGDAADQERLVQLDEDDYR